MEQNRNHDMQLVHTLAHYIHEGGEYDWDVASHLKNHDLEPGQEMHTIRIDDVTAFAKVHRRLKEERGWD
jgi:hypothetical protein